MAAFPFLRSPAFPGVAADVAAVSVAAPEGTTGVDEARSALALAANARVGGSFWSMQDPWRHVGDDPSPCYAIDDERAIVAWLTGVAVRDLSGAPIPSRLIEAHALALVGAASYRNCFDGTCCSAVAAVAQLAAWRALIDANAGLAAAAGIAGWKRAAVAPLLWDGRRPPRFAGLSTALALARQNSGAIVAWPSRVALDVEDRARAQGTAVWRMEDGFIRSKGLGSELTPPQSVVVDRRGLYYDPSRVSDLETILEASDFDDAMLARAARLRAGLCARAIGKYGDDAGGLAIALPADRRVVLAVGQVEGDRSVLLGGAGITSNLDFLRRVRAAEPDAFVIWRQHPDVTAGLRPGLIPPRERDRLADAVDQASSLTALFERVDAVHVLSSLTGFEALLRQVPVVVHGSPFYAGWGLTHDLGPALPRRRRRLTLDALVAGTLIAYPRYLDPVTRLPCPVEVLVERIAAPPVPLSPLRRVQLRLHRVAQAIRTVR